MRSRSTRVGLETTGARSEVGMDKSAGKVGLRTARVAWPKWWFDIIKR